MSVSQLSENDKHFLRRLLEEHGLITIIEAMRDMCQADKDRFSAYQNDLSDFLKRQEG
jgi:uncharacterized protein involved in type VI secretion and phage assembly